VWTGGTVNGIEVGRVHVGGDVGRTIEADTVIWAAGVGASPLGRTLGATLDRMGRVMVNPDLTVPGHDEVYVVGDLATLPGEDGAPLPGVIQVALQQARLAAGNLERTIRGQPREAFRYRDLGSMATIGRNSAVCDLGWLRLKGRPAWWFWLFLHVFKLIGFRNRLTVMTQWAFAYLTYQRSVRLITGDVAWREDAR